jgi:hypothetical protein
LGGETPAWFSRHDLAVKQTRWLVGLGALAAALAVADGVSAHALLTSPKPRDNRDDYKDPNGPCGPIARTNQRTVLAPGSRVTVKFGETIDHPGCFLVSYSKANDQNFQLLANVKHNPDGGASRANPRPYETTVTMPNETCDDCTLQLVQVMLANDTVACPPAQYPVGSRYYSCADISLRAGGDGGVITVDSGVPVSPDAGGVDQQEDAGPQDEEDVEEDLVPDSGKKKSSGNALRPNSGGGVQCSLVDGPAGISGLALLSSTLVLALAWARRRRR